MDKEHLKREFEERFIELRKIINSYGFIADAPCDEFDALNYQILSNLYKGVDCEKIKQILHSELTAYYGISDEVELNALDEISTEINEWWSNSILINSCMKIKQ